MELVVEYRNGAMRRRVRRIERLTGSLAGVIALVGLSNNPARDSHAVFLDLLARGFPAVGVNPGLAGKEIGGAPVYARLADVPSPIAIVDVFPNSEAAGETVMNNSSRSGTGAGAKWGPLELDDLSTPALPNNEWVRIRPRLSGICGSDLSTVDGVASRYFEPIVSFPFVPGHEVVADTEDGRRVVLEPVLGCITRGLVGSWLPVVYGNGTRIMQTADSVILVHEMVHEARVIPLDGRPHVGSRIRQYLGDSRGHWEGDTLVVQTTNFHPGGNGMGGLFRFADQNLKLTERFHRTGPDTLDYAFTVEDPTVWSRPWSAMVPWTKARGEIYEYACHEGNYSLRNMLSVARFEEKTAP